MKKTLHLLIILFVFHSNLYSQIEIGYGFDISGKAINNYYDPLLYNNEKPITILHSDPTFEYGFYISKEEKIENGLIRWSKNKLAFKKNSEEKKINLNLKDIKTIVIGLDSFFVADRFNVNGGKNTVKKRTLLKHLFMFENKAYASFSSEGFTSFYYKKKSDELWNKFSGSKKEFIQQISDEFGHLPEVRKKINLKKYKKKDLESTINTYKYYASMKSGTPIYFDKYWNETYSAKKSHYKAIVESKSDSLYKVIYY